VRRSKHLGNHVGREEIAAAVAARCGIPVGTLTADEGARLLALKGDLGRRVKGQPEAIFAVAEAVRLARAGLKKPNRPMGVFLFVGPSGTGKTELAKVLAENLVRQHCQLDAESTGYLEHAMEEMNFSARAHDRILKVARTLADLAGSPEVRPNDVLEAMARHHG
jgi:ATP-dependent Clp protease ATP-binding subunit ClpA